MKRILFFLLLHIPALCRAETISIGPAIQSQLMRICDQWNYKKECIHYKMIKITTDKNREENVKSKELHWLRDVDDFYMEEISDDKLVIRTPLGAPSTDNLTVTGTFEYARPVKGQYTVYGSPPYQQYTRPHTGVDISCPNGVNTKIYPLYDGQVVFAGEVKGYGSTVIIRHSKFSIFTRYAHLGSIDSRIEPGTEVTKYSVIGLCGNTTADPNFKVDVHLHFETMSFRDSPELGGALYSVFLDPFEDFLFNADLYTERKEPTPPNPVPPGPNPPSPPCSPIKGTCPQPPPGPRPPDWPPDKPWPPTPAPPNPPPPGWPPDKPWPPGSPNPDDPTGGGGMNVSLPHDPNAMYGPAGYVAAGQTMTYQVEFENTGDGVAYGVYVTDVLDTSLDDSVLSIKDSYAVDWQTGQQTAANFQYAYDQQSRTLTLMVGEVGSRKGGKFTIETRLKNSAQPGAIIPNYATVHFPTVLEVTPTNTIVSAIPRQTQILYTGSQQVNYSDDALLMSTVSINGQSIVGKIINYTIGTSSYSAITDEKLLGIAAASVKILLNPGIYAITAAFPGDGYYYLSSTQTATLTVLKDYAMIPDFSTTTYSTTTASVSVGIVDDEGDQLLNQDTEPKTLYLQYQDSETWKALGTATVSSGTAHFTFYLPQPLQTVYALKASFDGDGKYTGTASTGSLRIVDISSPTVAVLSPVGDGLYSSSVPVHYLVQDNLDPAPTSYAYFTSLADGTTVVALNNAAMPVSSLERGSWTLTVVAQDFTGNRTSTTTGAFSLATDLLPPHTTAEFVNFKSGGALLYAGSGAVIVLRAIDDMAVSGDGGGSGVAALHWRFGDSDWQIAADSVPAPGKVLHATVPISGLADGLHPFRYYAEDKIGNVEQIHVSTFAVDTQPPAVVISSPEAGAVFSPSSPTLRIAFSYSDAIDTAPVVSARLLETEDKGLPSATTAFVVANGDTLAFSSVDDGLWRLEVSAQDGAGNSTTAVSGVFEIVHDTVPPRSALSVAGTVMSGGVWFATAGSVFTVSSMDDLLYPGDTTGAGVRTQYVSVKTSSGGVAAVLAFEHAVSTGGVFASTFTLTSLSEGRYSLEYYASDFPGNAESTRTAAVSIDASAPITAFLLPSTSAVGVQNAFTGIIAIKAVAYDLNLSSWSISFAPAVFSAWTVVSSGTVTLSSGTVVPWNTFGPSGYYNLQLAACDLSGNCAAQIAPVYIGLPKLAQIMGRRERIRLNLQSPRSIDVGPDGLVWIADAGADRVLGVNGSGVVVHELGGGTPRKKSVRLERPQSVAVDNTGNVYVADTGNHRVLKLTPSGTVLLEISQNGKRACKLFHPSALALDTTGNIYVADKNHSRVSVFASDGQLLRSFSTTLQPDDYHFSDDYADKDWDRDLRGIFDNFAGHDSRPAGIAVSADGSIWISDERQNRLLQFSPTGTLLKTVGSNGTQAGKFRRPAGLRIDDAGLLYVADRLNRRAQKLDTTGHPYLSIIENLYQPVDLAFADDGDLWVLDSFRCAVARYSLPEGTGNLPRNRNHAAAAPATATSLLSQLEPDHALYITDTGVKVGKLVNTSGGNVTHTNGALAQLPAGALPSEIEVTIAESTHTVAQREAYLKTRRLMPVGTSYEFGPEGLSFASQTTLTLPYDSSQIPMNKSLTDVAIYNWDDITGAWVPLETQFVNGKLAAKTTHFSVYQAMVSGVNPLAATAFAFRQFYVYPNPAKGGNRPTLHFECGIGDGADIRIYDVAGDLRHTAHMTGAPNISAPEYAYEYTWDMGGAGSGVYTAVMEAHNGGETVKAKKKFAIIR